MANTKLQTTKHSSKRHPRKWYWAASVALVIIGLIVVLEVTNATHIFHTNKKTSSTIPETPNSPSSVSNQSKQTVSTTTNTSSETSQKSSSGTSNGGQLIAPFGSFVSNHYPGKNGSPSIEESVCNTTPGASCYIQFTKDGVIKKLDAKTADANGSVIWDWDIKKAGLTDGSWQITAFASLNDQTKSTVDPNGELIVVSP